MIKIKIPMLIVCLAVVIWGNVGVAQDNEHHSVQKTEMFIGVDSPAGKVVMQFHLALRTGDKITARKLLADDVLIFEGGEVERSADEYAHHHMLSDMKYLAAMKSESLEQNVKVVGNIAISMSRSKTTGTNKKKERNYESMETMVLEKQQGKWKIVRIHWSN
jgi:ketosteroid isomerase-like protein